MFIVTVSLSPGNIEFWLQEEKEFVRKGQPALKDCLCNMKRTVRWMKFVKKVYQTWINNENVELQDVRSLPLITVFRLLRSCNLQWGRCCTSFSWPSLPPISFTRCHVPVLGVIFEEPTTNPNCPTRFVLMYLCFVGTCNFIKWEHILYGWGHIIRVLRERSLHVMLPNLYTCSPWRAPLS